MALWGQKKIYITECTGPCQEDSQRSQKTITSSCQSMETLTPAMGPQSRKCTKTPEAMCHLPAEGSQWTLLSLTRHLCNATQGLNYASLSFKLNVMLLQAM
jgi:hypothetical protein